MKFLYVAPVFFIALFAAVIGGALVPLVRRFRASHLLTTHHEVAFPMFLQLGVIYAVLLAFIFSFMLNNINEAYTDAKAETTNILTLAQMNPVFPLAMQQQINQTLVLYTKAIIHNEWPKMAMKQEDPDVSRLLAVMEKIYLSYNPKAGREEVIYAESIQHLNDLRSNRRKRIFTATEYSLKRPWFYLGILGAIVVAISYFFGMRHIGIQMLLTGALVFTITSIITLMIMMSHPFAGPYAIKPRVFENTLMRLQEITHEQNLATAHQFSTVNGN